MKPQSFLNALKGQITNALNGKAKESQGDASLSERLSAVRHFSIPEIAPPPAGYVLIEDGMMKPEAKLTDYEREREALLQPLAEQWIEAWLKLADIASLFNEAFDRIELLNQPRNTQRVQSGKKPSLTLYLLDRSICLSRRRSDMVLFQEDILLAAKARVDECVERWAAGGNNKIRQLAELSFTKNAQGEYSRAGMLRLRRLDTDDTLWKEAMDMVEQAEIVDGVSSYLLVSVRDVDGKYHPLPLDIASVRPYRIVPAP
jgi:hypothetical protein